MWGTAGGEAHPPWAWLLSCGSLALDRGTQARPSSAILGCHSLPSATLDPVIPFTAEKPGPEGSRLSVHFSLDLHIHSGRKGVSSAFTNMRKPSLHSKGKLGQASGSLLHSLNMRGLGTGSRLAPAGPGGMDADVLWSLTSMAHGGDTGTAGRGQGGEGGPRPHRSCCLQATCRTLWESLGTPRDPPLLTPSPACMDLPGVCLAEA